MTKIKVRFWFLMLFSLVQGVAWSEDQVPIIGASDYSIVFSPYVSRQMTESIGWGQWNDTYTAEGCVLTSISSGLITCLLNDSCSHEQPSVCALVFNARVGLRLDELAYLARLPYTGQVPFLNQDALKIFDVLNLWEEDLDQAKLNSSYGEVKRPSTR